MAYLLTLESKRNRPEAIMHQDRMLQLLENTDPFSSYRDAAKRFSSCDPVEKMMLTDLTVQLPDQFLVKVDRATMASGVEARVPLLDEKLVKLAVRLPAKWKARGMQKKIILRKSQIDRLPIDILNGPKTGFGVPYEQWLRTGLYEFSKSYILDTKFINKFNFRSDLLEAMIGEHKSGRRNHGFMLWKLLQLSIWDSKIV
jgi:asparagine synthase (glutamine-hydrolysing)